jgi:uncharacterized protein YjbJ (UPF0337 family)
MNKDQIKGEWDEFKGRVKKAYGELTDDDFVQAQGSKDKLFGIIEQRFGDAKEKVIEKLRSMNISDKRP